MVISIKKRIYFYLSIIIVNYYFFIANVSRVLGVGLDSNVVDDMEVQAGITALDSFDTSASIGSILAVAIKIFLSLLGIIFVILILFGGYNWMTAAGEEEKVRKAQETIRRAIIGLIIIIMAYSVTYFVFKNFGSAVGSGSGLGTSGS